MKHRLAIGLVIAFHSLVAFADEAEQPIFELEVQDNITPREATASGAGAIIGGIAAGPLGAIIGVAGGFFANKTIEKAQQYDELAVTHSHTQSKLAAAQAHNEQLKQSLQIAKRDQQALALSNNQLHVLFATDTDELSQDNVRRLNKLASVLRDNPDVMVRLHGYADPRGSEQYNQRLSEHRSQKVLRALLARGINSHRIQWNAYGEGNSQESAQTIDDYARERRVSIELYHSASTDQVAFAP